VNDEGQRILDSIRSERGKTMRMHEILAEHDPSFLAGYNAIYNAAQSDRQGLPTYVRELLVMALDIAVGAAPPAVRGHARRAMAAGATQAQVLGAVELVALVYAGKAIGSLPVIFDSETA
jgi:alkylhydroperoxidase/carboxymuconolactone decarboxylase family protein YurZ